MPSKKWLGMLALAVAACGGGESIETGTGTGTVSSALTSDQLRVLGFESALSDWSASAGTRSASSTASQGSQALAAVPSGWMQIDSIALSSLGQAPTSLSFDVRVPSGVSWGEVRAILVLPSQNIWWGDLGAQSVTSLSAGTYQKVTFAIPASMQTALAASYSDLKIKLVLNAPAASQPYLFDNLQLAMPGGGGTGGSSGSSGSEFSVYVPKGVSLQGTFMSATHHLSLFSQASAGVTGGHPALASFGPQVTYLQSEAKAYANVYSKPSVQLDSKTLVDGFIRTSGTVFKQGVGTSDAPKVTGGEFKNVSVTPSITSWSVQWPATTKGDFVRQAANTWTDSSIAPGAYARFDIHDRNRIYLKTGTYFFDSFNTEPQAELWLDKRSGPIFIYVKNALTYKGKFVENGGAEGQVLVGYLGTSDAFLQAPFVGTIVAPNATIKLERPTSAQHKGSFFGKAVEVAAGQHTVLHIPFDFDFICPLGDSDGDGTFDCTDECPQNPNKVARGTCGCDEPDVDTDGDGVMNCIDECPNDKSAQYRGTCGCPSDAAPNGTKCDDGVCRGVLSCNAGRCGDESCKPDPSCVLRYSGETQHYYWFCNAAVSWQQADTLCSAADGSKLVQINGATENAFVAANLNASSMWTGANDRAQDGEWYWTDYVDDSGDKFWKGGSTGSAYFARFAAWASSAPADSSASCGQINTSATWNGASCTSTAGFVCEVGTERLTDKDWPIPRRTCELLGFPCEDDGPGPDCESEADAFGGLSEAEVLDAFANCAAACAGGNEGTQACADACTGPATPPGEDELCDDADDFADAVPSCGASSIVTPQVTCESSEDCPDGSVCSREYEGGGQGQPRLCVVPSSDCSGQTATFPPRCATIDLCEPDLEQTITDVVGPGADLDPVEFDPAEAFGEPTEAPPDPYAPDDDPCGGSCVGQGQAHPWCHLGPADATPDRPNQEPNKAGRSGGDLISFNFDPKFSMKYDADIGAFGLPKLAVTAEAGMSADINYSFAGGGSFTVIDVLAALDANECGVTSRAMLDVFGTDFIEQGVVDVGPYGLPLELPDAATQEKCREAFTAFQMAGDRAKKALRDAVELLTQYQGYLDNDDPTNPASYDDNFSQYLCRQVALSPPRGFPDGICSVSGTTESPEATINRYIEYYKRTVTGFGGIPGIQGLPEAAAQLAEEAFGFDQTFTLFSYGDFDEQTLASVQFFIGPIPCFLDVVSTVDYGVNLNATVQFKPGTIVETMFRAEGNQAAEPIAYAKVEGEPYAGAGLGVFAGAGFGIPGFEAKIGLQADLYLGTVYLPAHVGAGIGLGAEVDERDAPSDVAPFTTGVDLIPPKRYVADLQYGAGLDIKLRNVLNGSVSGKLKISVLFFSKTWRKTLLNFTGICAGSPNDHIDGCDFELVSLEGSTNAAVGSFPWAQIRMPTTFPQLAKLQPGVSKTGYSFVDMNTVEHFFYDTLCTCIDGNNPEDERECFRDEDCCKPDTPNCFNEPTSGKNMCIKCRLRGDTCNDDLDCCGSASVCNVTEGKCEGTLSCNGPCKRDDECVTGQTCQDDGTCWGLACVVK